MIRLIDAIRLYFGIPGRTMWSAKRCGPVTAWRICRSVYR